MSQRHIDIVKKITGLVCPAAHHWLINLSDEITLEEAYNQCPDIEWLDWLFFNRWSWQQLTSHELSEYRTTLLHEVKHDINAFRERLPWSVVGPYFERLTTTT